jgi:D-lactate dehydrogenase (cytochrome)
MAADKTPITIQGARTGIAGGAVPKGGHLINLQRMNKILGLSHDEKTDTFSITTQPGISLAGLGEALRKKEFDESAFDPDSRKALRAWRERGPYFFPPDPTETTATLGGMASCNASGARSYRYGPTRDYIDALGIVFASGQTASILRGRDRARGDRFEIGFQDGSAIRGVLPGYPVLKIKNAAGYFSGMDIDLVDLFIGQEGTLGIISALRLKIIPRHAYTLGVLFFFEDQTNAVDFTLDVRERTREGNVRPSALEFFDSGALKAVGALESENISLPDPRFRAAVYVEADESDEDLLYAYFVSLDALAAARGGDPDADWAGSTESERERLRLFRHAVPEAVNAKIAALAARHPGLTKLGSDFAVKDGDLKTLLSIYNRALSVAGMEYVMFGHIGNNHLHVNIIPQTLAEYEQGKKIFTSIAEEVVRMGGTVSAEHGVGKLKRELLRLMYGEEGIAAMKRLKTAFDPRSLLNPGNLFEPPVEIGLK